MNVAETRLCLLLHSLAAINDSTLARMLLHFGSPTALVEAGPPRWRELGLPAAAVQALAQALRPGNPGPGRDIDAQLAALAAVDAIVLPVSDPGYPPLLRAIHDPPPLLYVRGRQALLAEAQMAIVGSRRASPAGERAAGALAGDLAGAGLLVTSGLALGIDGSAHRGALAAGGGSIAVLATGIDRVYPARHRGLALELARDGCLVSEFPPGMPPLAHNFPRRNRIISGLALGVLVIEAALPSGSLITARTALEQGREVFALPWSIYHAGGAGCLHLIRDGARLVQTVQDVLDELGPLYALQQELFPGAAIAPAAGAELSAGQLAILQLVGYELVGLDELVCLSAQPVARVLAALSCLELQGLVVRDAGGYIRS